MAKSKSKKWYAIKDGKGVKNKILTSWTECEKLVKGYPAIYKSFKSEEEAKEYLVQIKDTDVPEVRKIYKKGREYKEKRKTTTKPLNGVRIPNELYEIIDQKAERDNVKIEKLVIEALQMVFE
ncbi:RNase H1/viroplasmin domain-containing protein [Clostridium tarantellae]|uniref:Ribonuclease H1 N-terminal domain-containing protein n=1 Tax=Clostridium tarantellae TaxID=39493 RepID=A0A6I1MNC0_9CLOT|nr:RNase H1/viroplasmin domain-containing protein [Clostridium tarantellae]MPQ44524.1 hypothetical protein [Clostridium tarantellae]